MEKLPAEEKAMHIDELANILGTSSRTIRRYVEKLFPDFMRNGYKTWLSEMQVTAVKLDLEKNSYLDKSVQLPKTDLEKRMLVLQAMNILNEEVEELKTQLEQAQPKIEFHDRVGNSAGLYSINEAAKVLGTGRNKLFVKLRTDKIFFERQLYQHFIDRGYFEVKTTTVNDHMQKQSFVTPKGLQWLQKQTRT